MVKYGLFHIHFQFTLNRDVFLSSLDQLINATVLLLTGNGCMNDCSGADDGWMNLCDPAYKRYIFCSMENMYARPRGKRIPNPSNAPRCGGNLVFDAFKGCQPTTSTCTITLEAQNIGKWFYHFKMVTWDFIKDTYKKVHRKPIITNKK